MRVLLLSLPVVGGEWAGTKQTGERKPPSPRNPRYPHLRLRRKRVGVLCVGWGAWSDAHMEEDGGRPQALARHRFSSPTRDDVLFPHPPPYVLCKRAGHFRDAWVSTWRCVCVCVCLFPWQAARSELVQSFTQPPLSPPLTPHTTPTGRSSNKGRGEETYPGRHNKNKPTKPPCALLGGRGGRGQASQPAPGSRRRRRKKKEKKEAPPPIDLLPHIHPPTDPLVNTPPPAL